MNKRNHEELYIPCSQGSELDDKEPPPKKFITSDFEDELDSSGSILGDSGGHDQWKTWSPEDVGKELKKKGLHDIAEIFIEQEIVGEVLPLITEEKLTKMKISTVGKQLQVQKFILDVTQSGSMRYQPDRRKIFNDPIHGHVELHPLCVSIIDTPQFQRLRFLKQLGACYFVYPGAAHNRFEHCIGVCHLAGQLCRAIQKRQPELGITDKDILCVEIAGLCHDLGHGPFSHLFDGKFIPVVRKGIKWQHEDASAAMFDYLLSDNNLKPVFAEHGLAEEDITFIKEQVAGPKKHKNGAQDWPYAGRSTAKRFLYEVVANKRNGIDVDKWDYFARDCHMLGIKNNFDHTRFMQFARVLEVDGELQICSRDKEVGNLYDMFHTRNFLHRRAYQHPVNDIMSAMITEALCKANDHLKFKGKDGQLVRMSEAIEDMVAYTQLNDYVFFQILNSTSPELEEAAEILRNILRRNLYKCVGQTQIKHKDTLSEDEVPKIKQTLVESCTQFAQDSADVCPLSPDDIIVHLTYLDYGMKDKNPIDNVRFYMKDHPNIAIRVRKDQVSQMLPESFAEQYIRVYCKQRDEQSISLVRQSFIDWCKKNDYPPPKGGNASAMELTPVPKSHTSATPPGTPTQNCNNSQATPGSAGKFKARLSF